VGPLQHPPPYEKLVGDLKGAYSRRINIQHRLVYEVFCKKENLYSQNLDPFRMKDSMRDKYDFDGARNNPYTPKPEERLFEFAEWQIRETNQTLNIANFFRISYIQRG
jgi:hypothetical protein